MHGIEKHGIAGRIVSSEESNLNTTIGKNSDEIFILSIPQGKHFL